MSTRARGQRKAAADAAAAVGSTTDTDASALQPMLENQKLDQTIEQLANTEIAVSSEEPPKRKWGVKKPISGRERRLRQNKRLRKLLVPKTALQSFNELSSTPGDFKVESNGTFYVAEVIFNNIRYEGNGKSKIAAKNDACEKVMRDLVIEKLSKRNDQNTIEDGDDVEMKEGDEDEEVPMIQLASFALHKLFSEWSAEGFEVPELTHGTTKVPSESGGDEKGEKSKKSNVLRTELPSNAADMHPTMALAMMRSNIQYEDLGASGVLPTMVYNVGVTVDGQQFMASARSKKLARRIVAIKVCNQLFGADYTEDAMEVA